MFYFSEGSFAEVLYQRDPFPSGNPCRMGRDLMGKIRKLSVGLILSFFLVFDIFAAPVNVATAEKVATNWYRQWHPDKIQDAIVKQIIINKSSKDSYEEDIVTFYTFRFEGGGFVLVSADDAVIPILGFSFYSDFEEEINIPALQELIKQ